MIERLANLADRPFRGHPGLNGFLISVGLLVLYVILMPPLFWLIGRLFRAGARTARACCNVVVEAMELAIGTLRA